MIKKFSRFLFLVLSLCFECFVLSAAFPVYNGIMEEPQFKKKVEAFWNSYNAECASPSYDLDLLKEFDLTELPFVFSYGKTVDSYKIRLVYQDLIKRAFELGGKKWIPYIEEILRTHKTSLNLENFSWLISLGKKSYWIFSLLEEDICANICSDNSYSRDLKKCAVRAGNTRFLEKHFPGDENTLAFSRHYNFITDRFIILLINGYSHSTFPFAPFRDLNEKCSSQNLWDSFAQEILNNYHIIDPFEDDFSQFENNFLQEDFFRYWQSYCLLTCRKYEKGTSKRSKQDEKSAELAAKAPLLCFFNCYIPQSLEPWCVSVWQDTFGKGIFNEIRSEFRDVLASPQFMPPYPEEPGKPLPCYNDTSDNILRVEVMKKPNPKDSAISLDLAFKTCKSLLSHFRINVYETGNTFAIEERRDTPFSRLTKNYFECLKKNHLKNSKLWGLFIELLCLFLDQGIRDPETFKACEEVVNFIFDTEAAKNDQVTSKDKFLGETVYTYKQWKNFIKEKKELLEVRKEEVDELAEIIMRNVDGKKGYTELIKELGNKDLENNLLYAWCENFVEENEYWLSIYWQWLEKKSINADDFIKEIMEETKFYGKSEEKYVKYIWQLSASNQKYKSFIKKEKKWLDDLWKQIEDKTLLEIDFTKKVIEKANLDEDDEDAVNVIKRLTRPSSLPSPQSLESLCQKKILFLLNPIWHKMKSLEEKWKQESTRYLTQSERVKIESAREFLLLKDITEEDSKKLVEKSDILVTQLSSLPEDTLLPASLFFDIFKKACQSDISLSIVNWCMKKWHLYEKDKHFSLPFLAIALEKKATGCIKALFQKPVEMTEDSFAWHINRVEVIRALSNAFLSLARGGELSSEEYDLFTCLLENVLGNNSLQKERLEPAMLLLLEMAAHYKEKGEYALFVENMKKGSCVSALRFSERDCFLHFYREYDLFSSFFELEKDKQREIRFSLETNDTLLHLAVCRGDTNTVKGFIKANPEMIFKRNMRGEFPLDVAVDILTRRPERQAELKPLLLSFATNRYFFYTSSRSLFFSESLIFDKLFSFLKENGKQEFEGISPLGAAILGKNFEAVKKLLEHGINTLGKGEEIENIRTSDLLCLFCLVSSFLKEKDPSNLEDVPQTSHFKQGCQELIKELKHLFQSRYPGFSILKIAIQEDLPACVKLFFNQKFEAPQQESYLDFAIKEGKFEAAKALVQKEEVSSKSEIEETEEGNIFKFIDFLLESNSESAQEIKNEMESIIALLEGKYNELIAGKPCTEERERNWKKIEGKIKGLFKKRFGPWHHFDQLVAVVKEGGFEIVKTLIQKGIIDFNEDQTKKINTYDLLVCMKMILESDQNFDQEAKMIKMLEKELISRKKDISSLDRFFWGLDTKQKNTFVQIIGPTYWGSLATKQLSRNCLLGFGTVSAGSIAVAVAACKLATREQADKDYDMFKKQGMSSEQAIKAVEDKYKSSKFFLSNSWRRTQILYCTGIMALLVAFLSTPTALAIPIIEYFLVNPTSS